VGVGRCEAAEDREETSSRLVAEHRALLGRTDIFLSWMMAVSGFPSEFQTEKNEAIEHLIYIPMGA
jgi:hypothetical protein